MACAVSGVLVLALPIPIVVENFAAFYDDQKFQQLLQEKKDAHYADILHQYAAQEVALAGLLETVKTNTGLSSPCDRWVSAKSLFLLEIQILR